MMEMNNMFNGMCGRIQPGMCKLSMNGAIAIKTGPDEYKTYNVKTGRLTNCKNLVITFDEDFFFLIPTTKVKVGDIILVSGEPRCVISVKENTIEVINYKNSTVETILPERHIFMGQTYFYGKIVSLFGNSFKKGKNGMNTVMKYMMLSSMFNNNNKSNVTENLFNPENTNNAGNAMMSMMPMMMLMNSDMSNMFDNMFDDMDMDTENNINIDEDDDTEEDA